MATKARVKRFTQHVKQNEFYKKVEFGYLDGAVEYTYDVEALRELFTLALISDDTMTLVLFGDEQFDDLTDTDLHKQVRAFINKPDTLMYMKKEQTSDLKSRVFRFIPGDLESLKQFRQLLLRMIYCKVLPGDEAIANKELFAEYRGWNSARYDLPLLILIYLALKNKPEIVTPSYIRDLSNYLIEFDDKPYKFAEYINMRTMGVIKTMEYKTTLNTAIWYDGHIDWAKIAKSDDLTETDKLLPPALKKEMARDGMDIIIDESVANDNRRIWSQEDKDFLVDYNFNDVLGTRVKGEDSYLHTRLKIRDTIRKMYPYTAARNMPISQLTKYTPSERDATAANLAALVLIGPNRIKAKDYEYVDYAFPVPDPENPGKTMWVDLWEYIKESEAFIPPQLDEFFSHFRGKDTRSHTQNRQVIYSQPVTKASTMNVPYYRDGKPTDSCCRVSTGGAHGFIYAGLRLMSPAQIDAWIRAHADVKLQDKPTVDLKNVIHVDWSSFYPTMASKMQKYLTSEGYDRYSGVIDYRIKIKQSLPYDRNEWTAKDYENSDNQEGLKFILNNATGAANTHNPYALLPLDNKTLSMRLIGNMFIWTLAQRLTQAGAFIIATNTDGLFLSGISIEKCEKLIEEYVEHYGMGVEPEPLSRFINRDTSNRIEFVNGHRQKVGGRLRHAHKLEFTSMSLGQNIQYPLIAANAALEYMSEDEDWLTKPYDRKRLVDYITQKAQENHPDAWYHVYVGSRKRNLMLDHNRQQRINRVILTKDGQELGINVLKAMKKQEYYEFIQQLYAGINPNDMIISGECVSFGGYLENLENPLEEKWAFVKREETREFGVRYLEIAPLKDFVTYEEYDEFVKANNIRYIGVYNPTTESYEPIEKWTYSTNLTDYPSNKGIVVNTAKELREFDNSRLDLDAYVRWAEQLLKGWKVTNNVPEIGLVQCDDTVIPTTTKPRVTKAQVAIDTIYDFYTLEKETD